MLTCYDYSTARLVYAAGINMILVGDSLGMTMQGYTTTLPATMDEMIVYGRSVVRGCQDMLGISSEFVPKFVRHFAELGQAMTKAFASYDADVKACRFPEEKHTYIKSDCSDAYLMQLDDEY